MSHDALDEEDLNQIVDDLLDQYDPEDYSFYESPFELPSGDPYSKLYCKSCHWKRPPKSLQSGELTMQDRYCRGRWFVPKYRMYPSNIWHLAREVLKRMSTTRAGGLPSEREIRQRIRAHPCNRHFRKVAMFMPRFKSDRLSSTVNS